MRILFVTPYVPSLIRVRPFNFIKQLSKRHEIVLVSLVHGEKDEAAVNRIREYCEKVHIFPLSRTKPLVNCCRRLLSRTPLQAAYTTLPSAREFISRIAESGSFDMLHVEHIRGAHLAEGAEHIPRVYDSVDCITRLLKLKLAQQSGSLRRVINFEELLKMRSYEPRVAAAFDAVVITSKRDKRALEWLMRRFAIRNGRRLGDDAMAQRLPIGSISEPSPGDLSEDGSSRVVVVGNGVDSDYFRPMPVEARPAAIVFSGRMSYFPNISGALQFYKEVFPLIGRKRPDATFKIVGSDPPGAIRRLARDPAVEITGCLPDIRPHLASAEVVVCPLAIGVGIQNKVLEAMSMGKAVVATSAARRGIPDAVEGRDLVCAGDPSRMAEAVLGILSDRQYGHRLGKNARRFVMERYSWDDAARALEAVYARTVDVYRHRMLTAA